MANDYYNTTGTPAQGASGASSPVRAEFTAIETGMAKLPTLTAKALEIIRVNTGETALESITVAELVTALEASGIYTVDDASNSGVSSPIELVHTTSGSPQAGIGTGLDFGTETTAGNETGLRLAAVTTNVGSGTEDFDFVIYLMIGGAAVAEVARFKSDKTLYIDGSQVLSKTALGATVLASSLTSLGTIASLVATDATITTLEATGTLEVTGASTLTGATTFGAEIVEAVGAVGSGLYPELDPADGTIQTWTLAAGTSEPTEVMTTGEFITLHITSGGNPITWTHVDKWMGGVTPELTNTAGSVDIVELWKVGTDVFGVHVGVAAAAS